MKTTKSKIYDFYMAIRDRQLGDMPTESFVKMLKNTNRAREIFFKIETFREESRTAIVTKEVQQADQKLEQHSSAVRMKLKGLDYEYKSILSDDEYKNCMNIHNSALEKLTAVEKTWRKEEIEIEIDKIPEADFVKFATTAVRKSEDKEIKLTQDEAALLYEILV